MKLHRSTSVIALVALIGAAVIGMVLTARIPKTAQRGNGAPGMARQEDLVDQHPLQTARALAALAATDDEQQFAQDAVRIADHEVDLAFASALRGASQQPVAKKNAAMEQRIDAAQAHVKQIQTNISSLNAQIAKAKGASLADLQQQLTLNQAQLDLAKDELADAQQDMARTSGDRYNQIERMWQEHEQTQHANGATRGASSEEASSVLSSKSLIARWSRWSGLASEKMQIEQARAYVLSKANDLIQRHNALEQKVSAGQAQRQALEQESANLPKSDRAHGRPGHPAQQIRETLLDQREQQQKIAAARLAVMRSLSQDEVNMADFDRRIQDLQNLGAIYTQWSSMVALRERVALHRLIRSAFWVLLSLLLAVVLAWLATRVLDRMNFERKQRATLHGVAQFTIQALAALVILLVLFGSPNHVFTVLGLAGAGLTVALKDFVVAFCGWFVLMGRNGIHVGDWVEINGVRGEVMEIGLLRTLLLETGNWTEAGHPTGRQVAFLNSYAVEGYFFNFSTAGQWMWDDLSLIIPKNEDPYPLIEQIRTLVTKETEPSLREAEEEWRRAAHRSGFESFSAGPEINLTPGDSGTKLIVRYMTKAAERYEVRSRLSRDLVKLLHHGEKLLPMAPNSDAAETKTSLPAGPDGPNGNRPAGAEEKLTKAGDKD